MSVESVKTFAVPFRSPSGESITVKAKGNLTCNDGGLIVDAIVSGLGIGLALIFCTKKILKMVIYKYYSAVILKLPLQFQPYIH